MEPVIQKVPPQYVAVSFPQYDEHAAFLSCFPAGGLQGQGTLLVIPLGLQGKNINRLYDATIQKKLLRFYRTQPLNILIRSIAVEGDFAQFPLKGVKLLMRQRNFGCAKVFNYPFFPAHSRNRDDEALFVQHPRQ